jgi:SPP1 gp7 family putative phage head morphogenesis protein
MRAAHDRAFVVAGAMQADLLADLREAVRKGIEEGTTLEEFRRDFRALVEKNGWTGWTGEGTKAGEAWRTKVIYETNLRSSYAAGRYQQMQAIKHRRPYWRYRHNDSVINPRPEHLALDGTIVHADDPFWTTHFPPNGWGCRCYVETLAARDLERLGIDPDSLQAPEVIIDPKTGDPIGIDKGWGYAPGANAATELQALIDRKLLNLEAPIGAALWEGLREPLALEREQAWWETLDDWLSSSQRGRTAVVGAVSPEVLDWLQKEKRGLPAEAGISVREGLIRGAKQTRHEAAGDGLMPEEWRRLPAILNHPSQVLFDTRTGKVIYIVDSQDAGIKLSVAIDYRVGKRRTNMIVSGFRQSAEAIAQMIRGGLYQVIR